MSITYSFTGLAVMYDVTSTTVEFSDSYVLHFISFPTNAHIGFSTSQSFVVQKSVSERTIRLETLAIILIKTVKKIMMASN